MVPSNLCNDDLLLIRAHNTQRLGPLSPSREKMIVRPSVVLVQPCHAMAGA
jgi:hypothetical protein